MRAASQRAAFAAASANRTQVLAGLQHAALRRAAAQPRDTRLACLHIVAARRSQTPLGMREHREIHHSLRLSAKQRGHLEEREHWPLPPSQPASIDHYSLCFDAASRGFCPAVLRTLLEPQQATLAFLLGVDAEAACGPSAFSFFLRAYFAQLEPPPWDMASLFGLESPDRPDCGGLTVSGPGLLQRDNQHRGPQHGEGDEDPFERLARGRSLPSMHPCVMPAIAAATSRLPPRLIRPAAALAPWRMSAARSSLGQRSDARPLIGR